MTNTEILAKIRAEIERLQPNAPKPGNMKSVDAKVAMQVHARLNKLLSFLSDLEKSLTAKVANGEELNWEIEKYFTGWEDDSEYGQALMRNGACAGVDECKDIARHFAQWGAEHFRDLTKKMGDSSEIPKDLLDAQVEIVEKLIGENNNDGANAANPFACEYVVELLQKAVSAGAKWDREQMMEEAVEGEVFFNPYPTISLDDCKDYDFKDGDKVRIIVCKKED